METFAINKQTGKIVTLLEAAKDTWLATVEKFGGTFRFNEKMADGDTTVESVVVEVARRNPILGSVMDTQEFIDWAKGTLNEN